MTERKEGITETRGQQRITLVPRAIELGIVTDDVRRLSGNQLMRTLAQNAFENMHALPLKAFEDALGAMENPESEHGNILYQISEIGVLTHIIASATPGLLNDLSQSTTDLQRTRVLNEEMQVNLAQWFTTRLHDRLDSPEKEKAVIQAIRAVRNLSIIADDLTRQLLGQALMGDVSYANLGGVLEQTGRNLLEKSPTVANELFRAEQFINAAERGIRKGRGTEKPADVSRRSPFLLNAMTTLAREYISEHGNDQQAVSFAARTLVRAFFAHQLHWVEPKKQVLELARMLKNPTNPLDTQVSLECVLAQFLLEAQLTGLIDPSSTGGEEVITQKDYLDLGFDDLFDTHQEVINKKKQKSTNYVRDPIPQIPEGARVVAYLLFSNLPHLGYPALLAATIDRLKRSSQKDTRPWVIVVSLNQRDAKRDERSQNPNQPAVIPFQVRGELLLASLAGLLRRNVVVTSIENVVGHHDNVPQRIEAFRQLIEEREGTLERTSGFDRHDFARPHMPNLTLGLRGGDLLKILKEPEILDKMIETFPETRIKMALLCGVSDHKASRVWYTARRFCGTGELKYLHMLQAMTHRHVTNAIIKLVEKKEDQRAAGKL